MTSAGIPDELAGQKLQRQLPEVFVSDTSTTSVISRAARRGEIRKLGPRLYTTSLTEAPEAVIRRNLWPVVGLLFPDTVVSHRTALEGKPSETGTVYLTGEYARTLELPGLRIRQLKGPGPLEGDNRFVQSLWIASQARALLECLALGRGRRPEAALSRPEIEERLETIAARGAEAANALRDRARTVAPDLDAQAEFVLLDGLLGTLLGTRQAALVTPTAKARAAGEPYDPARLELFRALYEALADWETVPRPDPETSGVSFANLAFADAYFSNFIEGTEFEVEEAVSIVFEGRIPASRPEDAHDVLGTYRLVGSPVEMALSADRFATDLDGFLSLLRRRHGEILQARPDKNPGEFKQAINRAGLTVFVAPELLKGTLRQGMEMFRSLEDAFKKAAFMLFMVSEVHPFDDGNGRLARAMMNAELIAGRQRRILIPTAYREDYLLALRALSRQASTRPLLRMLDRAQRFSARIDFSDLAHALEALRRCHAFETGDDARLLDEA